MGNVVRRRRNTVSRRPNMRETHRYDDNPINVITYLRVSTKHEEQLAAHENQRYSSQQILKEHPNWTLVGTYEDKGVTGTSDIKRPGFMKMVEDVRCGNVKAELLFVRDISRFSRNQSISDKYISLLKEYNVEVYFVLDNLWTFENQDFLVNIKGCMAENYSKENSQKVLQGQEASRAQNVLYGNGNILGYDLVLGKQSKDNTYVINPEQAETVKRIYELYLQGCGYKKIASTLIEEGRVNTEGNVSWHQSSVGRILQRKTYAGYLAYYQSVVIDFKTHKRERIPESERVYIKGDWEPIIPLETWEKVQIIRKNKTKKVGEKTVGVNRSVEKWCKKLCCECGSTYKKYKWRTNQSGTVAWGYQCNNQVYNRKKAFHIKNGLSGEGRCDVPAICQWKLELQALKVFGRMWKKPERLVKSLVSTIESEYESTPVDNMDVDIDKLRREIKRLEARSDILLERLLDETIDEDTYSAKKGELAEKIRQKKEELSRYCVEEQKEDIKENEQEEKRKSIQAIKETLHTCVDFTGETIDTDIIDILVDRVTPTEQGVFKWYMNLSGKEFINENFNENSYTLADTFTIAFEEARSYRKKYGSFLRARQWHDISVEVYLRMA